MSDPNSPIENLVKTSSNRKGWVDNASWMAKWVFGHFTKQLSERNRRRTSLPAKDKDSAVNDEITIIATVIGVESGQPVLKRINYLSPGSDEPRYLDFGDVEGGAELISRLASLIRLTDKGHTFLTRLKSLLLPDNESENLHSASVFGDIVEHTEKAMIVRFDLDGLLEERAFWWDEMSVNPNQLPVGTKVVGTATLAKAPQASRVDLDAAEVTQQINTSVENELAQRPEANKPLERELSPEDQARALEEWKEIMLRSTKRPKE